MIIGCDVDGVLADLNTTWLALYNRDYKDNLTLGKITEWDVSKLVKPECGKKIIEYLKLPRFYDYVKPLTYSLRGVVSLKKFGRVVFITTEIEGFGGRKYLWLKRYGFVSDLKDYVEAADKTLIKADIMIDDKPSNLFGKGTRLLFTQPWNLTAPASSYDMRVHNWLALIQAFSRKGLYEKFNHYHRSAQTHAWQT